MRKNCSVDGCGKDVYRTVFCSTHYRKFLKYGDPLFSKNEDHGMYNTPEYRVWAKMKERCYNKNAINYINYGAKNITVCDEWQNSFVTFLHDMGKRPFKNAQLDRRKNHLGYCKKNCRWVSPAENCQNRSNTIATPEMVKEIRAMHKSGIIRSVIRKKFDISSHIASSIILNKSWKNIC